MRHTSGDGSTSPSSLGARARSSVPQLPSPARGPEGLAGGAGSELEGLLSASYYRIERDAHGRAIRLHPMPDSAVLPEPLERTPTRWELALAYITTYIWIVARAIRREIDRGLEDDTVHLLTGLVLIIVAVLIMARAIGLEVLPAPGGGWRWR